MENKDLKMIKNEALPKDESLLLREKFINEYSKKKGWNPKTDIVNGNDNYVCFESNKLNENISKRISEISSLKVNWDGYGGSAPSKNTIELVNSFLIELPQKYIDLIHFEDIVPTSHGTVRIEWEKEGYFVSIEIGENGSGYYSELLHGEEPYNDNLESVTNPVPYEFLEALEKLYNS